MMEQAAHRTEVVCLAGSRQFTLLDVAASVGHGEVKVITHCDKTLVKTEKTNFDKLKLRYSLVMEFKALSLTRDMKFWRQDTFDKT